MSQNTLSITERRATRLVGHIVWLQLHMPSAAVLNHRVRELEQLVGTDSRTIQLVNQSKVTLQ